MQPAQFAVNNFATNKAPQVQESVGSNSDQQNPSVSISQEQFNVLLDMIKNANLQSQGPSVNQLSHKDNAETVLQFTHQQDKT
ncbi:hypothetical protein SESBI_46345, partial [Sesbania bispinosa]